jgi:hypothetical protein
MAIGKKPSVKKAPAKKKAAGPTRKRNSNTAPKMFGGLDWQPIEITRLDNIPQIDMYAFGSTWRARKPRRLVFSIPDRLGSFVKESFQWESTDGKPHKGAFEPISCTWDKVAKKYYLEVLNNNIRPHNGSPTFRYWLTAVIKTKSGKLEIFETPPAGISNTGDL